jgi:uncharacterized protein (DUF885 family)
MTSTTTAGTPRELADRFHEQWLAHNPFAASMYGIPGYDDQVPDVSAAGEERWRSTVERVLDEARTIDTAALDHADRVTLACLVESAERELVELQLADVEHTVTPMPFNGPATFFAVAARTVLSDGAAASDYVERVRAGGRWIDQHSERLRAGASKGRFPVAPIAELAVRWAEAMLAEDVPAALSAPTPPSGWDGAEGWRDDVATAARDVVKPALARWVATVRELLPRARSDAEAGLAHLPGGAADYALAIRLHTTLPLSADEIHATGRREIEALSERALELGQELGLTSVTDVLEAIRASSADRSPEVAIEEALAAVRRAEARAPEVFPAPLPPPCAVTPMPGVVASSGMAPHYTPPRLDGATPGTYWFNTQRPTAGAGWDLESVAFHETVPGHHLQLSRLQLLTQLPALQRVRSLTVFSEGWGLYAEQLAEEMGLYSDTRALLGAVSSSLMRAARLVVDTGLHALGWSRAEALEFFRSTVPMPVEFCASEVDRYVIYPGQALAYLTGKLELLALRDEVRTTLGSSFSLPEFHAAVLDSGSLPMPVLRDHLQTWSRSRGGHGSTL